MHWFGLSIQYAFHHVFSWWWWWKGCGFYTIFYIFKVSLVDFNYYHFSKQILCESLLKLKYTGKYLYSYGIQYSTYLNSYSTNIILNLITLSCFIMTYIYTKIHINYLQNCVEQCTFLLNRPYIDTAVRAC